MTNSNSNPNNDGGSLRLAGKKRKPSHKKIGAKVLKRYAEHLKRLSK